MANRFYLQAWERDEGYVPGGSADWGDSSILKRSRCTLNYREVVGSAQDVFNDSDATDKKILFRQHHSLEFVPGQELVFLGGGDALIITAILQGFQTSLSNNMYPALGIRIIGNAASGYAVRKVVLPVTLGDDEYPTGVATSRINTFTAASGNYTTVGGDRLCVESGTGGDPGAGFTHSSRLAYRDDSDTDLSAAGQTAAWNPWVEIPDDYNVYEFVPEGQPTVRRHGGVPHLNNRQAFGRGW
jgi:hypothetical protein